MTGPQRGIFTPAEVRLIRAQWDSGEISVSGWARAKGCGAETVRRIGRRETYAQIADRPPSFPSADEPDQPGVTDEEGMRRSLERLQQVLDQTPPSAKVANELLDELTLKAKEKDHGR